MRSMRRFNSLKSTAEPHSAAFAVSAEPHPNGVDS
jgi:hypothetical protein